MAACILASAHTHCSSRLTHSLKPWIDGGGLLVFSFQKTYPRAIEQLLRQYYQSGFDHGVGHPLLLLYDAKAPLGKNSNYFNGLGHDFSNSSIRLFYIIIKYTLFITI